MAIAIAIARLLLGPIGCGVLISVYTVAACLKQCIVGVGCLTVIIGTVGTDED